jgi:dipeptidyl aminopeptidase/acylaminoacyl peptidase
MSAMLVTLTDRLAAAIPISPVSNWYSQHFTSQIPSFDEACLDGSLHIAGGQYFDRSPTFHAAGATTPTLTMAGALDRNTPPTQALEFHRALLEAGCRSALCTYPEDGHSLRGYPAYLDSAVRMIVWLDEHCPGKAQL